METLVIDQNSICC